MADKQDETASTTSSEESLFRLIQAQLEQLEANRATQIQLVERVNNFEQEIIRRITALEDWQSSIKLEVFETSARVEKIEEFEGSLGDAEERLATVNAKLATAMHETIKAEVMDELLRLVKDTQDGFEKQLQEFCQIKEEIERGIFLNQQDVSPSDRKNVADTPRQSFVVKDKRSLQKPTFYDGEISGELPSNAKEAIDTRRRPFVLNDKRAFQKATGDGETTREPCSNAREVTSTPHRSYVLNGSSRPLQKPTSYDGESSWEAYFAQFEIICEINKWDASQKAAYLATSLKGNALNILANLTPSKRQDYDALVTALAGRFGSTHRTELSRVHFKNRTKQRDETFPALAEDIERLGRLAYPDAPSSLQDVLARDQFVDAVTDDDMRLRLKQERPATLQKALEVALELESFQMASRQRYRVVRNTTMVGGQCERKTTEENKPEERVSEYDRVENLVQRMGQSMENWMRKMDELMGRKRFTSRERARRDTPGGCWECGEIGHIRRNCLKRTTTSDTDSQSSNVNTGSVSSPEAQGNKK